MTKFADQLYEDLMREHGDGLRAAFETEEGVELASVGSRHRAARPVWLTGGLVTATGAVAGGFVLFGGAVTPAYAVTQNSNGTVTVAVSQASAIDAANAKLKAIGVRAVVVPVGAGCPSLGSLTSHGGPDGRVSVSVTAEGHDGQVASITVDAKGVPADETMVLAFESSGGGMFGGSGFVVGAVPSCVSLPGPLVPPVGSGAGGGSSSGGSLSGHDSGSSGGGSSSTG